MLRISRLISIIAIIHVVHRLWFHCSAHIYIPYILFFWLILFCWLTKCFVMRFVFLIIVIQLRCSWWIRICSIINIIMIKQIIRRFHRLFYWVSQIIKLNYLLNALSWFLLPIWFLNILINIHIWLIFNWWICLNGRLNLCCKSVVLTHSTHFFIFKNVINTHIHLLSELILVLCEKTVIIVILIKRWTDWREFCC